MKILLFGKDGNVGWELQRSLAPLGHLSATGRTSQPLCGDLQDLDGIVRTIDSVQPDVIVNAAAYTAVDKAESDRDVAGAVNVLAPAAMAAAARRCGALLVHYSTDYVFDGSGDAPWHESDHTGPLSVYGQTKLDGELAIVASGCRHLIFRTSWVYATRGAGFAKTMLRLAQERDQLRVINDQFGAPTGAELLADVTAHCIRQCVSGNGPSGVYHLVASGQTTWYDYARLVIARARAAGMPVRVAQDAIEAVPTTAYPTPARRPLNSRLNTDKLQDAFQVTLPAWELGVIRMLDELIDQRHL